MARKLTPQEKNKQREKESQERENNQTATDSLKPDSKIISESASTELKAQGKDRLINLITNKVLDLKILLIPVFLKLLQRLGERLQSDDKEASCSIDEHKSLLGERNQLVTQMNNVVTTINRNKKVIEALNTTSNVLNTTLNIAVAARIALSIGVKFIPSPPGAPGAAVSGLNDLKNTEELIKPKLEKIIGTVDKISMALTVAYITLFGLIQLLNALDNKIVESAEKCGFEKVDSPASSPQLIPLNDDLREIERVQNEVDETKDDKGTNNYKGFILETVEEPYTDTVNRIRAVAKNSQGIILLRTDPSFTTIPELLIQELKLIIDRDNLSAI